MRTITKSFIVMLEFFISEKVKTLYVDSGGEFMYSYLDKREHLLLPLRLRVFQIYHIW